MRIMIDPGHGGKDPGASGYFEDTIYLEKDLNLTSSLFLGGLLNSRGSKVFYTRSSDEYVSLSGRARQANRKNVDFFLSIHINSFSSMGPRGFGAYHYPASSKGRQICGVLISELFLIPWFVAHGDGIFPGEFTVLRKTKMPAVLLELGYINNIEDLKWLSKYIYLFDLMQEIARILDSPEILDTLGRRS